jgi:hypothetical protein
MLPPTGSLVVRGPSGQDLQYGRGHPVRKGLIHEFAGYLAEFERAVHSSSTMDGGLVALERPGCDTRAVVGRESEVVEPDLAGGAAYPELPLPL